MRVLTKFQLTYLLNTMGERCISLRKIESLYEAYGDEYFKESSYAPFVLTKENQAWDSLRQTKKYGNNELPRKGTELF